MKHEANIAKPVADMSEDAEDRRIHALLATLPPCPGLPSTDEEIAAAEARALADIAAGRIHSLAAVGEWLKTVGDPDFKPFKEWFAARNG